MRELEEAIASLPGAGAGVLVAFSGGVDSAVVLRAACAALGPARVAAVYFSTFLHPAREREEARRLAQTIGAAFSVLEVDELRDAGIENNPPDRCYLCKRLLFTRLRAKARERGISAVLDGTNADDLHEYRPGLHALRELRIDSPLARLGLTKGQVRALAGQYGLSVSGRPASPCLATRVEYNTPLVREQLESIGAAEDFLRELGFEAVRVRRHGDIARVEVEPDAFMRAAARRAEILRELGRLGFRYVTLDLEGLRSGSMDPDGAAVTQPPRAEYDRE